MTGRFRVEVTEDTISIYDGDSIHAMEIAHWIESEWVEDPSVVISICNAIVLAYEDPGELLYKLDYTLSMLVCSSCENDIVGAPKLHTCNDLYYCADCYEEAVSNCSLC